MGKLPDISFNEFQEILKTEELPIFIDCWAPWCGPCRSIEPFVEQLAVKYNGKMKFYKMNMDLFPEFAQRYMISSLPTFVIFKSGKPYSNLIGANRGKLQKLVEEALKN